MDTTILDAIVDKSIPEHFLTSRENDSQTPQRGRKQRQNSYLSESDEKREARLAANRERMRNIRMNETPEQKQARQAYNRIRARLNLIKETAEQRQKRLESNRLRMKANREKYSEQRRRMRALESPEKREKRLLANRLRNRNARMYETDEQRERRRADNRERQRMRRAQETPEEVEMRRSYNRARMTIRRSLMKLKNHMDNTQYNVPKQEPVNYGSDNELDVDLDYVIPDVVINMVEDADTKDTYKPNNPSNVFEEEPDFNVARDGPVVQPSIGDYIQKCITTIDNILNSDSYQNVNVQQQQTITQTALGKKTDILNEENRTADQFTNLVLHNLNDQKTSYN